MKRIGRILLNVATVVSLVLCVAIVAIWVRSYRTGDSLSHVAAGPYLGTDFVVAWRGRLLFHSGRLDAPTSDVPASTSRRFAYQAIPLPGVADPTKNPAVVMRAGFGWGGYPYGLGFGYPQPTGTMRVVVVPLYAVASILTVPPFYWSLMRLTRQRALRRVGLCPSCNYDRRATPERCPECGTMPARSDAPREQC